MTQRSVELTEELDTFVESMVAGGHYADASEVVRDALSRLEMEDAAKLLALRAAIEEGLASGLCEGDAFADVRREMGWESER